MDVSIVQTVAKIVAKGHVKIPVMIHVVIRLQEMVGVLIVQVAAQNLVLAVARQNVHWGVRVPAKTVVEVIVAAAAKQVAVEHAAKDVQDRVLIIAQAPVPMAVKKAVKVLVKMGASERV